MGSHGSFAGMQARIAHRGKDEDGALKVVVWVGGVPREEQIVFSISWAMMTAVSVLGSAIAAFEQRLRVEEAPELLKAGMDTVAEYHRRHFVPWAQERGLSVEGMVALFDKTPEIFRFYEA